MPGTNRATAVIAAAGSGQRLGTGGAKAFVVVGGESLLSRSLSAFCAAESIGAIVIAAPPEAIGETEAIAAAHQAGRAGPHGGTTEQLGGAGAGVAISVVSGGTERSQSVANAIEGVETELVVVHDAARPFVTPQLIDEIVERLAADADCAAVVAAAPVTDTIKRAGECTTVAQTLDRSHLWAVQTPQAFRAAVLREALADPRLVAVATDDAMLVESLGHRVELFEAPASNFKITTPHDLHVAELLLQAPGDNA